MFKKLFNRTIKFFAKKHLPHFSKCKPSWYKSKLEIFPLSIKTMLFYNFFINLFNNSVWASLLKAIPETKRFITPND